jgi:hypothetical protein
MPHESRIRALDVAMTQPKTPVVELGRVLDIRSANNLLMADDLRLSSTMLLR